ncbi:MAG: DUF1614 domain-containing protein [Pyrobaculum sp.]
MRVVIAIPFHGVFGLFYTVLAVLLLPFFMTSFVEILKSAGLSTIAALLVGGAISLLSLATSPINVVIYTTKRRIYTPVVDYVVVFGMPIPIPRIATREEKSHVAINVGGALLPAAVATYLLPHAPKPAVFFSIAIASTLVWMVSRVVPGVGVVTPAVIPPVVAVLAALPAGGGPIATYITAVYGTIIGADLLNLRKVLRDKPPFVSIGGAGVFDGIFLSGMLAATLSMLF